jgi:alpha-glucosidase
VALPGLAAAILGFCAALAAQTPAVELSSPDSQIRMKFSTPAMGGGRGTPATPQLVYEVAYRGKPVIARSMLGLEIQGQAPLGPNLGIAGSTPGKINETYTVPAGKASSIRNECNTLTIETSEAAPPNRHFLLEARAYNDGVAFRYRLPAQDGASAIKIVNERTQFVMGREGTAYPLILRNYRTSWEDNYHTLPISGMHRESLVALPLLMELPGTAFVAITEAHIENYSGMYRKHDERNELAFDARLSPRIDESAVSVVGSAPIETPGPWC